jgi:hypothetical protein
VSDTNDFKTEVCQPLRTKRLSKIDKYARLLPDLQRYSGAVVIIVGTRVMLPKEKSLRAHECYRQKEDG